jgi:hypothetical protein
MLPIVGLCIWIGLFPNTFLSRTEGSIAAVVRRVDEARTRLAQLDAGPAAEVAEIPDRERPAAPLHQETR